MPFLSLDSTDCSDVFDTLHNTVLGEEEEFGYTGIRDGIELYDRE